MSIGRALAALAMALAAWCAVSLIGFMLAVASVTGSASGAEAIVLVTAALAAVAAAAVTVGVVQRGDAHGRLGSRGTLGLAMFWPVVFLVVAVVDDRALGGPPWLGPVAGILGVAAAAATARSMTARGGRSTS